MPKSFQKAFIFDNRIVKFRYYEGLFQARYRKQGYNIEVASKDFDTMKKKFIEKLIGQAQIQDIPVADPKRRTAKTVLFADYAKDWLKLKEQTTKPSTFKEYSRMFEVNLRPTFGHLHLSEITRPLVQQYLFTFVEAGKYRTAEKLKLMLNCIFDMAAEDFNLPSPMKKIVLPYHESKKGCALTKAEEIYFPKTSQFTSHFPMTDSSESLKIPLKSKKRAKLSIFCLILPVGGWGSWIRTNE